MSARGDQRVTIDLVALTLRGGEAARLDLRMWPDPPVAGGEQLAIAEDPLLARVDVSRTSSGFALRLRSQATVTGTCARCLEIAERRIEIDAREVDQASADDPELRSPYVSEGLLDVDSWLRDTLTLELPEQLLCGADCAGLCEVCGISLNAFAPGEHRHDPPPDPRFAKLRELTERAPE